MRFKYCVQLYCPNRTYLIQGVIQRGEGYQKYSRGGMHLGDTLRGHSVKGHRSLCSPLMSPGTINIKDEKV